MNNAYVNDAAELLKALAHPTRLQIVHELIKGIRCVTDIQDIAQEKEQSMAACGVCCGV